MLAHQWGPYALRLGLILGVQIALVVALQTIGRGLDAQWSFYTITVDDEAGVWWWRGLGLALVATFPVMCLAISRLPGISVAWPWSAAAVAAGFVPATAILFIFALGDSPAPNDSVAMSTAPALMGIAFVATVVFLGFALVRVIHAERDEKARTVRI